MSHPRNGHLLSSSMIQEMEGVAKVHFLNPKGRRINKSLGDATGLQNIGVHWVEVAPGAESTEMHRHLSEEEAVYVLEGEGSVQLDEEVFEVGPGDFIGLPAGGPAHVFSCSGPSPLRLLVVGQRLPTDVADYPRLNKRLYRHGEEWDLVNWDSIHNPKKGSPTVGSK